MPTRSGNRWTPTSWEDAVDYVEDASCVVCGAPIDVGATPASMLASIEADGPISLALAHGGCSDSRVIPARVEQHPPESIEIAAAMRWHAHLRLLTPGAMLLWDELVAEAEGPGMLGPVLGQLGFEAPVEPLGQMTPPAVDSLGATLRGDDLSLIITAPEAGELELMSFPEVTGGPWIEQARVDRTIIVVYGRLRLGRSPIGFSDPAIELGGEILAAAIPFWD